METYEGRGVELAIDGDVLVLTKKAMFGKDTTRRIPIQALAEVRFKQAGRLSPGSLQLVVAGEPPRKADFNDPNTVMFLPKFNDSFSALHDHLAAAIQAGREQGLDASAVGYDPADPTRGDRIIARMEEQAERLEEKAAEMGERRAAEAAERAERRPAETRDERMMRELSSYGITRPDVVEAVMAMQRGFLQRWSFYSVSAELSKLVKRIRPDENVRRISRYRLSGENQFGLVALTDARLMIFDRDWMERSDRTEEFPLHVITSVSVEGTLGDNDLRIYSTAGHAVLLERLYEVEAFANAVRDEVARATAPQPAQPPPAAPPPDVLDQLAKLAQLRDAGVVTAEEFEAKKAQLLDRL